MTAAQLNRFAQTKTPQPTLPPTPDQDEGQTFRETAKAAWGLAAELG